MGKDLVYWPHTLAMRQWDKFIFFIMSLNSPVILWNTLLPHFINEVGYYAHSADMTKLWPNMWPESHSGRGNTQTRSFHSQPWFQRNYSLKRRRAMGKSGVTQVKCDTVHPVPGGRAAWPRMWLFCGGCGHRVQAIEQESVSWSPHLADSKFPSQLLSQLCLLPQLPFGGRQACSQGTSILEVSSARFPESGKMRSSVRLGNSGAQMPRY